jgi:hypothetical protein
MLLILRCMICVGFDEFVSMTTLKRTKSSICRKMTSLASPSSSATPTGKKIFTMEYKTLTVGGGLITNGTRVVRLVFTNLGEASVGELARLLNASKVNVMPSVTEVEIEVKQEQLPVEHFVSIVDETIGQVCRRSFLDFVTLKYAPHSWTCLLTADHCVFCRTAHAEHEHGRRARARHILVSASLCCSQVNCEMKVEVLHSKEYVHCRRRKAANNLNGQRCPAVAVREWTNEATWTSDATAQAPATLCSPATTRSHAIGCSVCSLSSPTIAHAAAAMASSERRAIGFLVARSRRRGMKRTVLTVAEVSKLIRCQRIVMISRRCIDSNTIAVIVDLRRNAIVIARFRCVCHCLGVVLPIDDSSIVCHKKCDQSANEQQCNNAANNATDQRSVVVRRLSGRSDTGCSIRGRRCLAYNRHREACRWRRRCCDTLGRGRCRRQRRRHRRQGQCCLSGGGCCCCARPRLAYALGGRFRRAILLRMSTSTSAEAPVTYQTVHFAGSVRLELTGIKS